MIQPSFSSLTFDEAISNLDLLKQHANLQDKNHEAVFGFWGRRFIRVDKNEKILYRAFYWLFVKMRIIQTEQSNPIYFNALKEASENKFKQLVVPYTQALTYENENLKLENTRLEKLRAQAVEDIHALKKAEGKIHKAHLKEKLNAGLVR